jgi:ABC-2 type transport system ATP-binding protein
MAIIASGRIVRAGAPLDLVRELEGRMWHKTIETRDLEAVRREHDVISSRLFGGRTIVHVLAPQTPGDGFGPAPAVLEDVYFSTLSAVRRAA